MMEGGSVAASMVLQSKLAHFLVDGECLGGVAATGGEYGAESYTKEGSLPPHPGLKVKKAAECHVNEAELQIN